ncbi:MAG: ethylbenzene dehydrogenase-related protein [bacterium]
MSKRVLLVVFLAGALGLVLVGLAYNQGSVLTAVKVDQAPILDGRAEGLWDKAQAINVQVFGGANMGSTTVSLKAVYTGDSIYFLAQWADPTQSLRHAPWQKQADGSWAKLKDPNDKGGDNNLYYEDKMAFIWNIGDSIANFNSTGCFVVCHAGEAGKPYGNKYTSKEGELGDIWHWKAVRTGPVGQIDDQYVDHTRYDKDKAPEAGRHGDPKTGGGYYNNRTDDGRGPKFAMPGNKPAPPYWIIDSEKVAIDDTKYKAGDEVPGIIIAPFAGDRGDISSGAVYADGKWTLEWGRKLSTGSKFDVQFTDLSKSYFFGVAVFDNAQVRHAFNAGALELRFAR